MLLRDFVVIPCYLAETQLEGLGKESVDGFPLGEFIAVLFVGEVKVVHITWGTKEGVDAPSVWELDLWRVFGPVSTDADKEQRSRGSHGGDFRVIGLVGLAFVNGHAAFAVASTVKVGRSHDYGSSCPYAWVKSSQNKGLGAATGFARDADAAWVHLSEAQKIVESSHAVPSLVSKYVFILPVVDMVGIVVPAHHIVGEDNGSHAGEGGATRLCVFCESTLFGMSVGTKDAGKLAESAFSERTVQVTGDKKAGKTLEVNVFN